MGVVGLVEGPVLKEETLVGRAIFGVHNVEDARAGDPLPNALYIHMARERRNKCKLPIFPPCRVNNTSMLST